MKLTNESGDVPSLRRLPAVLLRTGCTAVLMTLGACGGGGGDPPDMPAARSTGAAKSIDDGTGGNPVGVRVAQSAGGDGFVAWQADTGNGRTVWASRYSAASEAWGEPVALHPDAIDLVPDFDLTADAAGNAVAVWSLRGGDLVWSARYDANAGTWSTISVPDSSNLGGPRGLVANEADDVLLTYAVGFYRFYDLASDAWLPRSPGALFSAGTGGTDRAMGVLDSDGNALGLFVHTRGFADLIGSTYYTRSTGVWDQLPPDAEEGSVLNPVPFSGTLLTFIDRLQVTPYGGGSFLAAWQLGGADAGTDPPNIRLARFTPAGRTWTDACTVVPGNLAAGTLFQRLVSDAQGNARLLLWTENDAAHTVLKAMRLDQGGCACDDVRTIDRAVGGGAAHADLAVDPAGDAIAVWQQFEGGRADDGSRSNIALSHFDVASGTWQPAELAETGPGNAVTPRASAKGGQALIGWIQAEGGVNRVKVMLQPLGGAPRPGARSTSVARRTGG